MTYDELVQQTVRMMFRLEFLLFAGGAVGLFALMGYFSLRILRDMPDFEHKAEMIWGARWFWLVFLAIITAYFAVAYLGATQTPYLITSMIGANVLLYFSVVLACFFLDHQTDGVFFSLHWLGMRMKGKKLEVDAWLKFRKKRQAKAGLIHKILWGIFILLMLAYGHGVLVYIYPLDRQMAEIARTESLGKLIETELDSPHIEELHAFSPIGDLELRLEGSGMQRAWESLRQILHIGTAPRPTLDQWDYYHLFIWVTKDTTPTEAQELLGRARQILAAQGEKGPWRIRVYSRDKHISLKGSYPEGASEE